ncbi:MAG: hypothetical protein AAB855_02950 [Patescibacteria group bacterium]
MVSQNKTATATQNDDIVSRNVFDILDLSDLPEDQKAQMLQKMLQIIYQRVVARIMDVLPESVLRNLKDAIDKEDSDTVTTVLAKHGMMSFPELMAEEALFLKFEMDSLVKGDVALSGSKL